MSPISNEEQLFTRLATAEHEINELKIELAGMHAEILGELKSIREFMQAVIIGNSTNCLRHQARIEALEKDIALKAAKQEVDTALSNLSKRVTILITIASSILAPLVTLAVNAIINK